MNFSSLALPPTRAPPFPLDPSPPPPPEAMEWRLSEQLAHAAQQANRRAKATVCALLAELRLADEAVGGADRRREEAERAYALCHSQVEALAEGLKAERKKAAATRREAEEREAEAKERERRRQEEERASNMREREEARRGAQTQRLLVELTDQLVHAMNGTGIDPPPALHGHSSNTSSPTLPLTSSSTFAAAKAVQRSIGQLQLALGEQARLARSLSAAGGEWEESHAKLRQVAHTVAAELQATTAASVAVCTEAVGLARGAEASAAERRQLREKLEAEVHAARVASREAAEAKAEAAARGAAGAEAEAARREARRANDAADAAARAADALREELSREREEREHERAAEARSAAYRLQARRRIATGPCANAAAPPSPPHLLHHNLLFLKDGLLLRPCFLHYG
ncbi:hypothetical protein AB1Y20_004660 [Prymnesium parvum]|uniref:Uncharacterized protein n=1 Tax=Prymnesium parvum TaxID=97485 RepID=A0AB34IWZ3_PRYPA